MRCVIFILKKIYKFFSTKEEKEIKFMNKKEVTGNNLSAKYAAGLSVRQMTAIALMTAVICVLGPLSISIPFSPVPISFTNFAIYLVVYALGTKKGTVSYLLYLLLGVVGLPVFSAFTAGIAKFVGPTGGYLIGFIFTAVIVGFFVERFPEKRFMGIIGMIAGLIMCYIFGTVWLALSLKVSFAQALLIGVVPYLIGDAVKIAVVAVVGPQLRRAASHILR